MNVLYKGQMNPKRLNQVERAITILDKSSITAVLRQDSDILFYFKKAERIVAAIYIITGILSDNETLKQELRAGSIGLLNLVLSFRITAQDTTKTKEATTLIVRLCSLLDLAYLSDLFTSSHISVIKQELSSLSGCIERRGENGLVSLGPVIPGSFFESQNSHENDKGQDMSFRNVLYISKDKMKKDVLNEIPTPPLSKGHFSRSTAIQDGRRGKILAILREKENKSVAVKDISRIIRDCSMKSIQRLLSHLVRTDVLKTEGEKRWMRYSLKEDSSKPSFPSLLTPPL